MTNIAIVVGGSARVWQDLEAAEVFCSEHKLSPEYFATNDMIQYLERPIVAVTLHPDKLGVWLGQRLHSRFPMPTAVYSHAGGDGKRGNPVVTHRIKDWGGSVGMFGYTVARERGHDRVILCGVPMTADPHFVRHIPWKAVGAFTQAWQNKKDQMRPYCRSLSGGLTEELFGIPTTEWATSNELEKAT